LTRIGAAVQHPSVSRPRIPTAADLGLMEGPPPYPPERLVTLANWQDPPFNRWGFQHVRDLIPTARIPRGDGPARRLPRAERDLSGLPIRARGRPIPVDRLLEETYTDGFLVLHRGRIVTERYFNGLRPDTTHLLMSVSKSLTSVVAGILVGRGLLDPEDQVTHHVPELRSTSFDACTVRHLLDMRAGTRFDEDYANVRADVRVYEQIYRWRPRTGRRLPEDITAYYPTLRNARPHGGPFEYRSILTDVLAWVIERAGGARFAELLSRELWRPMGAEFDAEVTVDAGGNAMADGGVCCTLRDLARFGQLMLDRGRRRGRQVVPRAWLRDTVSADPGTIAAFAAVAEARELPPGAFYRNQWWVIDPSGPVFQASGINGQTLLVHVPARVVIAKLSTWPVAWDEAYALPTTTGLVDLARKVAAEAP
jgi:CubicO group peptidase (beta-lactamase class C family)